MVSISVLFGTFRSGIHMHTVYWNCAYRLGMELSEGGCFPNLVRYYHWTTVHRQSLWITTHTHTHTYIYIYTHIYTESNSKLNRMNFLFPQKGCNVRIKAMHILNAPPYCDDFISLLKRVFNSKLAARVSDINLLHFLLVLCYIDIHSLLLLKVVNPLPFFSSSSSSSFAPSLQSLLIIIYSFRIQLFWLLNRGDWKLLTGVWNNV